MLISLKKEDLFKWSGDSIFNWVCIHIQYNFWLIWKMSQKLLLKSWKIHSVMKKWKKYTIVVWKAAKWLGFWWQFYIWLENASSQAFQYSVTLNVWNSLSKWVMKKICKWKIKNFSKRLCTQSFFYNLSIPRCII